MKPTPEFENLFLQALLAALLRRRRTIRDQAGLQLKRERVRSGDVPFEWLSLELPVPLSTRLWVSVREDGFASIALRQHQKKQGWTFILELQAELWELGAAEIVKRIEATLRLAPAVVRPAVDADRQALKQIWSAPAPRPRKKRRRS